MSERGATGIAANDSEMRFIYRRRTFDTFTAEAIQAIFNEVSQGANANISVEFAPLPSDAADIEFGRANQIRYFLSEHQPSTGLRDYFTNFAISTWRLMTTVKQLFPDVTGSVRLWLSDVASGPGLTFCGNATGHVLIPDPVFLESAGYLEFRHSLPTTWIDWKDRLSQIFWRGASTGNSRMLRIANWRELPRFRLCALSAELNRPEIFDIGISKVVQIHAPEDLRQIEQSNYLKAAVPMNEFLKYKFAIDIDGNSASWPGLFTKLLMGNTVLKIDSILGFRQWYYDRLVPFKNFVPVSADMSDLLEIAKWLQGSPKEASDVAIRGQQLAESLTYQNALFWGARAIAAVIR